MPINILPKNVKFFELFKKESALLEQSAELLNNIFLNNDKIEDACDEINKIEDECHELVRTINRELYRNFLTPLDREDIHAISRRHHDVIYLIKAISMRIGLLNISKITEPAKELSTILKNMVEEIKTLIDGLEKIKDMDQTMHKIESMRKEGATLVRLAYAELYEGNRATPEDVLYIMQWNHIYDILLSAIEKTDNLATVIEGIILKNG